MQELCCSGRREVECIRAVGVLPMRAYPCLLVAGLLLCFTPLSVSLSLCPRSSLTWDALDALRPTTLISLFPCSPATPQRAGTSDFPASFSVFLLLFRVVGCGCDEIRTPT